MLGSSAKAALPPGKTISSSQWLSGGCCPPSLAVLRTAWFWERCALGQERGSPAKPSIQPAEAELSFCGQILDWHWRAAGSLIALDSVGHDHVIWCLPSGAGSREQWVMLVMPTGVLASEPHGACLSLCTFSHAHIVRRPGSGKQAWSLGKAWPRTPQGSRSCCGLFRGQPNRGEQRWGEV